MKLISKLLPGLLLNSLHIFSFELTNYHGITHHLFHTSISVIKKKKKKKKATVPNCQKMKES